MGGEKTITRGCAGHQRQQSGPETRGGTEEFSGRPVLPAQCGAGSRSRRSVKETSDIPLLAKHFLEEAARRGQKTAGLAQEALAVMMRYSWPGNVRELQNAMHFALVTSRGKTDFARRPAPGDATGTAPTRSKPENQPGRGADRPGANRWKQVPGRKTPGGGPGHFVPPSRWSSRCLMRQCCPRSECETPWSYLGPVPHEHRVLHALEGVQKAAEYRRRVAHSRLGFGADAGSRDAAEKRDSGFA